MRATTAEKAPVGPPARKARRQHPSPALKICLALLKPRRGETSIARSVRAENEVDAVRNVLQSVATRYNRQWSKNLLVRVGALCA